MNRIVVIAIGIGIAIIVGVIVFQVYDSMYGKDSVEQYYKDPTSVRSLVYPENPQHLYGLKINKDKYLLGENIFISIGGIPMGLKDKLIFYTPTGQAYLTINLDGDKKSSFKHYFRPQLSMQLDICEKEKLIGEWTVAFLGTPEDQLKFNVMSETLPRSESYYDGCNEGMELPVISPSLGED